MGSLLVVDFTFFVLFFFFSFLSSNSPFFLGVVVGLSSFSGVVVLYSCTMYSSDEEPLVLRSCREVCNSTFFHMTLT